MRLVTMMMAMMGMATGQSLRGSTGMIVGRWYQALASRFVVATSQVDMHCVYWDIGVNLTNDTVSVSVHSHLHSASGNANVNNYTYTPRYTDGKWILDGNDPLWVRDRGNGYLLLTGLDNVTFYALTPDINIFNMDDRGSVLDKLRIWDYATGYKEPISTYGVEC